MKDCTCAHCLDVPDHGFIPHCIPGGTIRDQRPQRPPCREGGRLTQESDRERILRRVRAERWQQDHKWGEQNHGDEVWLAILAEELGEAAQAILKVRGEEPGPAWEQRLEEEIVQCAAVAVSWLEARGRRRQRE